LVDSQRDDVIVGCGTFLALVPGSLELRLAKSGPWFAGGTLCFYRAAWQASPFRAIPSAVDAAFLEDHADLRRIALQDPELYILVRHQTNTWQEFPKEKAPNVTDYFKMCPAYHKSLSQVVGSENVLFYERIISSING
jgi:hypothetical protein